MTLRIAATLTLALGVTALLGFLHLLGIGPFASAEQRHMRAMKDRTEAPASPEPFRLSGFDSLPVLRPLAEYAAIERRGVVVEGYVKHMLREPDDDTFLEVMATPPTRATPMAFVTAEITPQWHRGAGRWSFESLRAAFRAASWGGATPWPERARRVRLTGWLLNDYKYETRRPDLTRPPDVPRVSGWEVHPVTKNEIWDDARAAFVEVPR